MERAENISVIAWPTQHARHVPAKTFAAIAIMGALVSAALASWLPLQASIVTVFLFAGPHNWFEARYFLMRLPARFGRSRNFFVVAFVGIGLLTIEIGRASCRQSVVARGVDCRGSIKWSEV